MTDQINDKPTLEQIKKRFSEVTGLTPEEVEKEIGATTEEEILKNIQDYTRKQIQAKIAPMNRAQRRALAKKQKNKKGLSKAAANTIADTTKKINYIDLIQKLQALNKKREAEGENYEDEN